MRVNFFGGACSSKSTTAAWLFSELKVRKYSVELIAEYVKMWAILGRPVKTYDQIHLFGSQMQHEFACLSSGIKNVVTDSPVLLSPIYSRYYNPNHSFPDQLFEICKEYERDFPSVNIFLDRSGKVYDPQGRYETEDQAKYMDNLIYKSLVREIGEDSFRIFHYEDRAGILSYVLERIN